jgi:hypothetical protein
MPKYMDTSYILAKLNPKEFAFESAIEYLFGKRGIVNKERGTECLLLASEQHKYVYPFLVDLIEDGIIEKPADADFKKWKDIASALTKDDYNMLYMRVMLWGDDLNKYKEKYKNISDVENP